MFRIEATARQNRLEITQQVQQAISAAGGTIIDYHQFSNISLTLTCDLPANEFESLIASIEQLGLAISNKNIDAASASDSITGFVVLTFIHDEPDLRIDVPAVPG